MLSSVEHEQILLTRGPGPVYPQFPNLLKLRQILQIIQCEKLSRVNPFMPILFVT